MLGTACNITLRAHPPARLPLPLPLARGRVALFSLNRAASVTRLFQIFLAFMACLIVARENVSRADVGNHSARCVYDYATCSQL